MTASAVPELGDLVASDQIAGRREYQEDRCALAAYPDGDPDGCDLLLVLADGMGGHRGGAEASRLAVDAAIRTFEKATGGISSRLRAALDAANTRIGDRAARDPACRGMGCTLVLCVVTEREKAHWISVGDSPLWRLRSGGDGDESTGGMDRLNADHSMRPVFERLVGRGLMTPDEAAGGAHQLRSAVTGGDLHLVDEGAEALRRGERIVLASDGLETLPEDEIRRLASGSGEATRIVAALLRAVEERADPRQDNATVVVYHHQAAGALRERFRDGS